MKFSAQPQIPEATSPDVPKPKTKIRGAVRHACRFQAAALTFAWKCQKLIGFPLPPSTVQRFSALAAPKPGAGGSTNQFMLIRAIHIRTFNFQPATCDMLHSLHQATSAYVRLRQAFRPPRGGGGFTPSAYITGSRTRDRDRGAAPKVGKPCNVSRDDYEPRSTSPVPSTGGEMPARFNDRGSGRCKPISLSPSREQNNQILGCKNQYLVSQLGVFH